MNQANRRTLTLVRTSGSEAVFLIWGAGANQDTVLSIVQTSTVVYVKNFSNAITATLNGNTITVTLPSNWYRGVIMSFSPFTATFS